MLLVPFERDFEKIAKINSQQEKPILSKSQKLVPAKHKRTPFRKIKLPPKFSATRYSFHGHPATKMIFFLDATFAGSTNSLTTTFFVSFLENQARSFYASLLPLSSLLF